jgi:putative transposase
LLAKEKGCDHDSPTDAYIECKGQEKKNGLPKWRVNHKRCFGSTEMKDWRCGKGSASDFAPKHGCHWCCPTRANQVWTMDFTRDSLESEGKFRALNVMDGYTREAPWIEVDTSLPGLRVAQVLNGVARERGLPEPIQVDKGPEFKSIRVFGHTGSLRLT